MEDKKMTMNNPDFRAETDFVEHLTNASYHYADDRGGEWATARAHVIEAARIAVREGWNDDRVKELYDKSQQLVAYDEVHGAIKVLRHAA